VRSGMMMMARVSGGRKRTRTESARARVRTGSAAHLLGRGRGDGDGSDRLVKHRIPRTIAAIGTGRRRSGRSAGREGDSDQTYGKRTCIVTFQLPVASREVIAQR
jgi:hypothetical protein